MSEKPYRQQDDNDVRTGTGGVAIAVDIARKNRRKTSNNEDWNRMRGQFVQVVRVEKIGQTNFTSFPASWMPLS